MLLFNGLLLLKMYVGADETSSLSIFFFPEMHLYFIMFTTAVCFLFLLNDDVIYRDNDDKSGEEDDDEDKYFISQATALQQTASYASQL